MKVMLEISLILEGKYGIKLRRFLEVVGLIILFRCRYYQLHELTNKAEEINTLYLQQQCNLLQ